MGQVDTVLSDLTPLSAYLPYLATLEACTPAGVVPLGDLGNVPPRRIAVAVPPPQHHPIALEHVVRADPGAPETTIRIGDLNALARPVVSPGVEGTTQRAVDDSPAVAQMCAQMRTVGVEQVGRTSLVPPQNEVTSESLQREHGSGRKVGTERGQIPALRERIELCHHEDSWMLVVNVDSGHSELLFTTRQAPCAT